MAWDSQWTAQLISGFQGMAMGNQHYAQQIGMGGLGGGSPMAASQGIMGMAMNRMQGAGAPMAQGVMGMMGLDPMSIGLRAGMGAFNGGAGLMGAGLTGMAAGGAMAGGIALAGYAGQQVYSGAQQQQQLNGALRQSFNFTNPMTGSQGFSGGQMGQIGSMMRDMSHQGGPGGEVVGMGELTSLAAGMGRMGMGNQVRDVQEFGKKFREMLSTVKTVATEIGSSLQEAQQFIASARGSGIFKASDQLKYATQAKGTAFAGGLAMSEVTAMGNIGAQISRSVGGLGRQGTFAGMNTIGQIGVATQMGVLSDEDIYNATGQYGAEGRQAMATSALQNSANFLRGGKGRRMLASIAGKNGSLDEGGVEALLSGGMTIGETMKHDSQNLGKVGRANFIRNEGRLRGAAMERLGGFLPAMQLREWAQGKGIDINDMDDRSMLFAQRQLGMGRDEVDSAVKMAQNMPQILQQMKSSRQDQAFMDKMGMTRKEQGVEGIKNRFNQARETVQGHMQKIGQDIFNAGSNQLEEFMNKLAGTYEQHFSQEAENAYKQSAMGGKGAAAAFTRLTGGRSFGGSAASLYGPQSPSTNFFGSITGKQLGGGGGALGLNTRVMNKLSFGALGAADYLLHGDSMASKFEKAGYSMGNIGNISNPIEQQRALSSRLAQIGDISRAAQESPSEKYLALGASNSSWLTDMQLGPVGGEARMSAFGKEVATHGSSEMKAAWNKADPAERARMMVGARAGAAGGGAANMAEEAKAEALKFAAPGTSDSIFGGAATAAERQRILGTKLTGYGGPTNVGEAILQGAKYGAGVGALFAGVGAIPGAIAGAFGGAAKYLFGGNKGEGQAAMAEDLASESATKNLSGLMSSDKGTREETNRRMQSELRKLNDKDGILSSLTSDEKGKQMSLQRQLAAAELEAAGGQNASDEKAEAIAKKYGLGSAAEARNNHKVLGASEQAKKGDILLGLGKRISSDALAEQDRLQSNGFATFSGGKVSINKEYGGKLSTQARGFLESMALATATEGKLAGETDPQKIADGLAAASGSRNVGREFLESMSVSDLRDQAHKMLMEGDTEGGGSLSAAAARYDAMGKAVKKKGAAGGAASALGINLTKEEQKMLAGMQDPNKAAKFLAGKLGVSGDADVLTDIKGAISAASEGGKGINKSADLLAGVGGMKSVQEAQKKKREEGAAEKDPLQAKIASLLESMPAKIASALGGVTLNVNDASKDTEGGDKKP